MRTMFDRVHVGALVGLLLSAAAAGQTASFDFDSGLESWVGTYGQVGWSDQDAGFLGTSGSMYQRGGVARACVPLSAPFLHHVFEAKVLIPPGNNGVAAINVAFHPQPDCTGSNSYLQDNIDLTRAGSGWVPLKVDTRAFGDPLEDLISPGTQSVELVAFAHDEAYFDELRFYGYLAILDGSYPCVPNSVTLCLGQSRRFQVHVRWEKSDGEQGPGRFVQQGRDSATVWFFGPDNAELLIKVLNGCGTNDRHWVFVSGLTNVGVTVEVLDTFTNQTRTYVNPVGNPFDPVLDTSAFATCS